MSNLTQIAEEVLLLSPGDATAKKVAAMLEELAQQNGLNPEIRKCAEEAGRLAKKLSTKKSTSTDLQTLLELLSRMEDMEVAAAPTSVSSDLVTEYLASQDMVLDEFEAYAMNLAAEGEQGFRALKRQVHTWKGELGIIGAEGLARMLHTIEDSLDGLTEESYQNVSDAMLELKDGMVECFKALREQRLPELDVDKVTNMLRQPRQQPEPEPIAAALPAPQPAVVVEQASPVISKGPLPMQSTIALEERKADLHGVENGCFIIPDGVDVDLVGEFRAEAEEHFQSIEVALMNLESAPEDMDSVNTVFRAFHTVKGVASFVGVSYVTEFAHKAENLLDRVRKGTLKLDPPFIDLVFESMDLLRRIVQTLTAAIAEGKYAVPVNYATLLYRLEHPEEVLDAYRANGGVPAGKDEEFFNEGKNSDDAEGAADANGVSQSENSLNGDQKSAQKSDAQTASANAAATDATVKVNMSRLDSLINMVGELVISQAMVGQDPDILQSPNRKLTQNVAQLAKITRSLQELALSMRMVSVKAIFQKMARLVRDVARKSNKVVELEMSGEETELDRNMVEAIADPLVHMVRNAVDHGIEPPENRIEIGKTRHGVVHLSAAHEGGSVLITLRDDGRGLNRDKILAKAVERGIIDPNAQLSDKEIYNLIFLPGFSTADKVTDVSGRGVGMDVVRTNIEKLRGSVEIDSTPGRGSVFRIRLPLTLAIIDGMVLKTGSQRFIIPTIAITESFRPLPQDIVTVHGRSEMVKLRGNLLPVCRLHSLFGIDDARTSIADSILIVAEAKSSRIAIMADALVGQQQVVIKSLGKLFDGLEGVAGCAILGDGRISLILDIEGILSASRHTQSSVNPLTAGVVA